MNAAKAAFGEQNKMKVYPKVYKNYGGVCTTKIINNCRILSKIKDGATARNKKERQWRQYPARNQ